MESVVRLLAPLANRAYACMNTSSRAAPLGRIEAALRGAGVDDVQSFRTVGAAVASARAAAEREDLILITGSFYTVADARPLFVGA